MPFQQPTFGNRTILNASQNFSPFRRMGESVLGGNIGDINFQDLMDQLLGLTSNRGEADRRRIDQGIQNAQGGALRNLQSRGLSSSTGLANIAQGFEGERLTQHLDLSDRLANAQTGILGQVGLGALDFQGDILRQLLSAERGGSNTEFTGFHLPYGGTPSRF